TCFNQSMYICCRKDTKTIRMMAIYFAIKIVHQINSVNAQSENSTGQERWGFAGRKRARGFINYKRFFIYSRYYCSQKSRVIFVAIAFYWAIGFGTRQPLQGKANGSMQILRLRFPCPCRAKYQYSDFRVSSLHYGQVLPNKN